PGCSLFEHPRNREENFEVLMRIVPGETKERPMRRGIVRHHVEPVRTTQRRECHSIGYDLHPPLPVKTTHSHPRRLRLDGDGGREPEPRAEHMKPGPPLEVASPAHSSPHGALWIDSVGPLE